jgi:ribose transport system substrate-binding protein
MHKRALLRKVSQVFAGGSVAVLVALSASSATAATTTTTTTTGSGCGQVPKLGFTDKSGLIKTLGASYEFNYDGYATPIFKSAYASIKPIKGKVTIGIAVTQPLNPVQAGIVSGLQSALKKLKTVKSVKVLTSSPTGLTQELQQTNTLINEHVGILIVEPLAPQPFIPIAQRAEKAGIPFISIVDSTATPDSINIAPNSVLDGARGAAQLAKLIGGKGTVLGVHGIQGTGVDTQTFDGFEAALKQCPKITLVDPISGEFQTAVTKQATLSFLTSNPQPIAGAVETASMATGIIQAFQQLGRPVPVIVDGGATEGDLAYLRQNPSKLADAYTITPNGVVAATTYTIEHLIAGHGPKISELAQVSLTVTKSNISKYVKAGTSTSDVAALSGPWDTTSFLAPLFNQ